MQLLTEYETTVVVRPDASGDAIEATLDKVRGAVTASGGKLLAIKHWGRKRLPYPVKKQTRGVFVHTTYLGPGPLVQEIERQLRISDTVLRYLTIRQAKDIDPETRQALAYEAPDYTAPVVEEPEPQESEYGWGEPRYRRYRDDIDDDDGPRHDHRGGDDAEKDAKEEQE